MINPCCDVTKTTVNEIKNVFKIADTSLLQVKIFQETRTKGGVTRATKLLQLATKSDFNAC